MHWKITALWGGKKVELRETLRAVTPFGGLVVFFEFWRRIGRIQMIGGAIGKLLQRECSRRIN